MTFVIGDIVQLKSGGPNMTVTKIGEDNGTPQAYCEWFTDGKAEGKWFDLAALTAATA